MRVASARRTQLTEAARAADRPLDSTPEGRELRDQLRRFTVYLDALPADVAETALEEALERLANPMASTRKLEKDLRRRALMMAFDDRAAEIAATTNDLTVGQVDQGWALVVETTDRVAIDLGVATEAVELTARHFGIPLELRFLAAEPDAFVAVSRRVLQADLRRQRQDLEHTATVLRNYIEERQHTPFYDSEALQRIVRRAIRENDPGALDTLLRVIKRAAGRLDREAREKERVRRAIHEHGLVAYKDYFPRARAMDRRLTFYCGPTNSGKTYHALNRLVEAESGAYLAPLRLLALEGQEQLLERGVRASFLTGEERDLREGANFTASTIEMFNPQATYGAVVIDEVQLLADPDRGWAWSQALVGAAAREVLLTGSPDAIPLVKALADYLDEPLEIVRLDRFTDLKPLAQPVPLDRVRPGTAVIAFSRREVLRIKAELERRFDVAVVYGNLTPDVRREEARRFRSGEAQVLVSTDAIALGLNLPIQTVLLSTTVKWDGTTERQLTGPELLQIGGRAGRYGEFETGYVGVTDPEDVPLIRRTFDVDYEPPARPLMTGVRPGAEHIEALAAGLGSNRLAHILSAFRRSVRFDAPFFEPGVTDDMEVLAEVVDRYPALSLPDRLMLSCAPISTRVESLVEQFEAWVAALANGRAVLLDSLPRSYTDGRARDDEHLHAAEHAAKRLTAYAWLAFREPEAFGDLERCQEQRKVIDRFIERSLASDRGAAPRRRGQRQPSRAG